MINRHAVLQVHNSINDFEAVAQEISRSAKVQNEVTTHIKDGEITEDDELLSQDETVDMILKQSVMNQTLREMKQNQQRIKEILNED
ncbi:hypothetical protein O1E22_002909 [Vibrio cholerae]|nr:hypothetical protein [Vibrio cholerae]EGQ9206970.1 hypothetical protein [Vibrio cholerae]EGQ9334056.1 hypothetical protein [Vibrio cholerae]EIA3093148.1 hypothetical protein [Vibrio cholerae]EJL6322084.1 hypothetical protein [Vibrio cholerae]